MALEPIDTEDFVIEYVGEVIRRQVFPLSLLQIPRLFCNFNEIRISKCTLESLLVDVPTSHLCFILSLVLFEKYFCMFFLSIVMRTAFPLEFQNHSFVPPNLSWQFMMLKGVGSCLKSLHPGRNFRLLTLNNPRDMEFMNIFQISDIRERRYETLGIGSSYLFRIDDELVVRLCLLLISTQESKV